MTGPMKTLLCCIALIALLPAVTSAEGLIYKLPADGHWVRFAIDGKATRPNVDDTPIAGTLTISCIGTAEVDGQTCRWVEIVSEMERNGETFTSIDKLLVPEEHVGEGREPLNHVVRGWRRDPLGGEEVRQTEQRHLQNLRSILHGPYESVEELDAVVIDTKLGKLECKGITASEEEMLGSFGRSHASTYTIRLHPDAPFGVVSWESEAKTLREGQPYETIIMKMNLVDSGTDAKSRLLDAN